jgi:hypothetical protein
VKCGVTAETRKEGLITWKRRRRTVIKVKQQNVLSPHQVGARGQRLLVVLHLNSSSFLFHTHRISRLLGERVTQAICLHTTRDNFGLRKPVPKLKALKVSTTTRPISVSHWFQYISPKCVGEMLCFSVKGVIIYSHLDLNLVSSSTDRTNLLGP